jgi:hypothetical protein
MCTLFPDRRGSAQSRVLRQPAGFFFEVGANEPRHGSQTWQFEQASWAGVPPESQSELEERLRAARARNALPGVTFCSSGQCRSGSDRHKNSGGDADKTGKRAQDNLRP